MAKEAIAEHIPPPAVDFLFPINDRKMKFGHEFAASLQKGEYPQEWVDSAVSYRRLKKCIKKVKKELDSFGLSEEMLNDLWQNPSSDLHHPSWKYSFAESPSFRPKLTIALDGDTNEPADAWLSPGTREHLEYLVRRRRSSCRSGAIAYHVGEESPSKPVTSPNPELPISATPSKEPEDAGSRGKERDSGSQQTIEIPLTSDGEFFQILQRELKSLGVVQQKEVTRLDGEINTLGETIDSTTAHSRSKAEAQAWREMLRIYTDSQIFFSSREKDAGVRDSPTASRHLREFIFAIHNQKLAGRLQGRARPAFDRFIDINSNLLRLMRFQELNRTAMEKIMKKFDKRTALQARKAWASSIPDESKITNALAKSACYQISQQLLNIVPQLGDYSCPICLNIAYKPIRLRCNHVFCIRCLIVMQRERQSHCPLCREESVSDASSDNLDTRLMTFLEAKFPKEVKAKHRENLRAAGIDQYGERYGKDFDRRCIVM